MAIEFRCTGCGKLLRTPDDTGGKQARCPECGKLLQIPAGGAAVAAPILTPAAMPLAAAPGAAANPYQAPLAGGERPLSGPGVLRVGDAFSRTWRVFKANAGMCTAVVFVATLVGQFVGIGLRLAAGLGLTPAPDEVRSPTFILISVVAFVIQMWIGTGQVLFFLKVARGEPASIADLFGGTRWFLSVLGATILFGLACSVGVLLFIVPGIIVALMLAEYSYLIVDRNLGPLEALRASRELTAGNKGALLSCMSLTMLLALCVVIPVGIIAALAGSMAGVPPLAIQVFGALAALVYMPWMLTLLSVCYLILSGQRTAAD